MNTTMSMNQLAYRPKAAAELLDFSTRTLRKYTSDGSIKCIRDGRLVLYRHSDLVEFLGNLLAKSEPAPGQIGKQGN